MFHLPSQHEVVAVKEPTASLPSAPRNIPAEIFKRLQLSPEQSKLFQVFLKQLERQEKAVSESAAQPRLIKRGQVLRRTKISKSTLYNKLNDSSKYYDPKFPKPVLVVGAERELTQF